MCSALECKVSVRALALFILTWAQLQDAVRKPRVYKGVDDFKGKYPYVVALVDEHRYCTGTLLTPQWVLTAAHCFGYATDIQYGNMSILPNDSKTRRAILRSVMPPSPTFWTNDIGLLRVRSVWMETYGKLSAADYSALSGHAVQYAGFGSTYEEQDMKKQAVKQLDDSRPLQLGEGVVTKCEIDDLTMGPFVCVTPKCTNREQDTLPGDSGGPLFLDGKLVAVLHGGRVESAPISYYTPVSPYLTWIYHVIAKPFNITLNTQPPPTLIFDSKRYVAQKYAINSVVQRWFKKV